MRSLLCTVHCTQQNARASKRRTQWMLPRPQPLGIEGWCRGVIRGEQKCPLEIRPSAETSPHPPTTPRSPFFTPPFLILPFPPVSPYPCRLFFSPTIFKKIYPSYPSVRMKTKAALFATAHPCSGQPPWPDRQAQTLFN